MKSIKLFELINTKKKQDDDEKSMIVYHFEAQWEIDGINEIQKGFAIKYEQLLQKQGQRGIDKRITNIIISENKIKL